MTSFGMVPGYPHPRFSFMTVAEQVFQITVINPSPIYANLQFDVHTQHAGPAP